MVVMLLGILNFIFVPMLLNRGKIISPGSVMLFMWDFFIIGFLCLDDRTEPYTGIVYIMFLIAIYIICAEFGCRLKVSNRSYTRMISWNSELMQIWIKWASIILVLPTIIQFVRGGGLRGNYLSYISDTVYQYYTMGETQSSIIDSILNQITSIGLYGTALLAGVFLVLADSKSQKRKVFWILIPGILQVLTTSGKLGFIITILMIFTGAILQIMIGGVTIQFKKVAQNAIKYGKWVLLALLLMFFSLVIRFGEINEYYINITKTKFANYSIGSVASFNIWFNHPVEEKLGYGIHTFTGILKTLGLATRERGVYDFPATTSGIWHTNVYTIFRPLIEDYGILGGIFVVALFGIISGYIYSAYKKKRTYGMFCLLAYVYLTILYSFIISPFIYLNLTVFIFVIVSAFCFYCRIKRRQS